MTREQIQEVIDKGGYLMSTHDLKWIYFVKPIRLTEDEYFWGQSLFVTNKGKCDEQMEFHIEEWREATPEEIERYTK